MAAVAEIFYKNFNQAEVKSVAATAAMKHGCGWEGAAPEFDAARCRVQRPTRLLARRCCV